MQVDMAFDKFFSGRVIFDHLPKTAGQALNKWLNTELGSGAITLNLIGNHLELIKRYGGLYPVISGHITFDPHEQLDPRYQYVTLLRDPIDRCISWIFFLLNNVTRNPETRQLIDGARIFLESDGNEATPEFLGGISNTYIDHFSRINSAFQANDNELLLAAFAAIKKYNVVGLYEKMPEFLADFAELVGIPAPKTINSVNVTFSRPSVDQISPALRQRIIDLNQLDIRLYNDVVAWKHLQPPRKRKIISVSPWQKYEPIRDRIVTTSEIPEVRARLREGNDVIHGQLISFDVDFILNRQVHQLEAGVHIFDENRSWAFGTNSTLQGKAYMGVSAGSHRVTHHLIACLPAGNYTAGFALVECLPEGGQQVLAWYDVLCEFKVYYDLDQRFAGYSYLPAEITLRPTTLANDSHKPSVVSDQLPCL